MGKKDEALAQLAMLIIVVRKAARHEVLTIDEVAFAEKYADDTERLFRQVTK